MNKNTDPKKLDQSNIGDAVVIRLQNGDTQSARLTHITDGGRNARFEWRTGPGKGDWRFTWIIRSQWLDRVEAIFPPGCKFLVVESPVPAAVV